MNWFDKWCIWFHDTELGIFAPWFHLLVFADSCSPMKYFRQWGFSVRIRDWSHLCIFREIGAEKALRLQGGF